MPLRFTRSRPLLTVLGVLLPTASHAQTLTMEQVLAEARTHHPALQAAQARADAAAQMPTQVGAYDDPVASWEAWNVPESLAVDRADNNIIRLAQKIPFPGKRTLAAEVARHDADGMRHDADVALLDVLLDAKHAYVDFWRAHRLHQLAGRTRDLTAHMARLVEQRYATGTAPQADVLRMQIDVTHTVGDVQITALGIDEALAALNTSMGAAPDTARGTPADPTPSALPDRASDLTERALQERPEVAVREAAVAREATALRLAERGYLPDFEVSVSRFRNTGASNGFGAMASMTLPLAWKSKYDAGVAQARARILSVTAERRRAEDLVRRDVRQAFLRAKTAGILHALSTSTHLPHADQALRTAEAAYVAGTSDLTALLDTLRTVTQVQREHVEALATLARARADLERAIGSDLPGRPTSARQEAHHD